MSSTPSSAAKSGVLPVPKPERQPKGLRRERETLYTFAMLPGEVEECWLAQFTDTPCGGRMTKAHLIKQQTIRKETRHTRGGLKTLIWDRRVWRPACWTHHQMLDISRTLRLDRSQIPVETEQFAREHGIDWWLTREYGPLPTLAGGS